MSPLTEIVMQYFIRPESKPVCRLTPSLERANEHKERKPASQSERWAGSQYIRSTRPQFPSVAAEGGWVAEQSASRS